MKARHFIFHYPGNYNFDRTVETSAFEIIIVEDNPYDAELIVDALRLNGLAKKVMVFMDGEQVLDYIFGTGAYKSNEDSPLPKLIILDLKMPKVCGFEVLKRLKSTQETKHVPVVVFTSSKEEADIRTAFKLGTNSYIVKPIKFDDFRKTVGELGLYWILLNEMGN